MDRNVERRTSSVGFTASPPRFFAAVRARASTRRSDSWAFLVVGTVWRGFANRQSCVNRGPNGLGSQHGCVLPNVGTAQVVVSYPYRHPSTFRGFRSFRAGMDGAEQSHRLGQTGQPSKCGNCRRRQSAQNEPEAVPVNRRQLPPAADTSGSPKEEVAKRALFGLPFRCRSRVPGRRARGRAIRLQ